jgi:hypothetical protein
LRCELSKKPTRAKAGSDFPINAAVNPSKAAF